MSELNSGKIKITNDGNIIMQFSNYHHVIDSDTELCYKHQADKVIAHHKYKRCVKMASNCRLRARWFGDNAFYKKEQWALLWHKRWLELAEKFKEAK